MAAAFLLLTVLLQVRLVKQDLSVGGEVVEEAILATGMNTTCAYRYSIQYYWNSHNNK